MAGGLGEDYEKREAMSVEAAKEAIRKSNVNLSTRQIVKGFFADLYESFVYPDYYSFSTCDSVGRS